ncbi:GntR family transcriptional regulator [Brooklawnia cerclae]
MLGLVYQLCQTLVRYTRDMGEVRGSVRQRVYEEVRRRIVSLELPPKSPISENDLARELGVSRTPVRESLLLLREEGFVQVFPQMGTFVSHVDIERVLQAQFIRESIECTALAEVDCGVASSHLDALHANLRAQREAEKHADTSEFFVLDEEFHLCLLRLSGRESAWPVVQSAKSHLDRARRVGLVIHSLPALIDQHQRVVDGVKTGDLDSAVRVLREHLREILTDLELIRQQTPDLFSSGEMRPVRRLVTTLEPTPSPVPE